MEIQLGKEYKTRDGHKVVIYATDKGGGQPIHGCVLLSGVIWGIQSWRLGGRYGVTCEDRFDIVSEWVEPLDFDWDCLPKWADRFIAMEKNGEWYCSNKKPSATIYEWIAAVVSTASEIPTSHAPKNYTGDWKDSLHENPKYVKNY